MGRRPLRPDHRLADALTPATHGVSIAIAEIPDRIRGYGYVKEKAAATAAVAEAELWRGYESLRAAPDPATAAAE